MNPSRPWLLISSGLQAGGHPPARLLEAFALVHDDAVTVLAPAPSLPAKAPFPFHPLPGPGQAALTDAAAQICRRHDVTHILLDERMLPEWRKTLPKPLMGRKTVVLGTQSAPTPLPDGVRYIGFSVMPEAPLDGQDWRGRAQAVGRMLARESRSGDPYPDTRLTSGGGVRPAQSRALQKPLLTVIVDTEEEFDWGAPVSSHQTDVFATQEIWRFQEMCERADVRPTYVLDYPVAAQDLSARIFRRLGAEGRAEIGAHLHAWVTPPYDRVAANIDSYQGNLDGEVEYAKLKALTDMIEAQVGVRPNIHKAGRYGIGRHSAANLRRLGYRIDLSPSAGFDFRGDGGPDFTAYSAQPFWLEGGSPILCLPTSGGVIGKNALMHRILTRCHVLDDQEYFIRHSPLAFMAERIRLSPEGNSLQRMQLLAGSLIAQGVKALTLSLHSTSLAPHANPYAADESDVRRMLDACAGFFRYFRDVHDGDIVTPHDIRARLLAS